MKLSIIIVNWNSKDFLIKCINSIYLTVHDIEFEVIIVDNNSDEKIDDLSRKYDKNIIIKNLKENLGFAKGSNVGFELSSGEYIALINPDIIVLENVVHDLLKLINSDNKIGLVGPKICGPDMKYQRSCMKFPTIWNYTCRAFFINKLFPNYRIFNSNLMESWKHDVTREVDVINGCFWIIRRSVIEEIGFLDPLFFMYSEDVDFCKRVWDNGNKIVFYSEGAAIHYGGVSSSKAPIRFYIEKHRANLQFIMKYNEKCKFRLYYFIIVLHHLNRLVGNYILSKFSIKRDFYRYKYIRSKKMIIWLVNSYNDLSKPVEVEGVPNG